MEGDSIFFSEVKVMLELVYSLHSLNCYEKYKQNCY